MENSSLQKTVRVESLEQNVWYLVDLYVRPRLLQCYGVGRRRAMVITNVKASVESGKLI